MKNILVLCTGNSCRSQMAHGYLKHFAGAKALIYSAGIETHGLNQDAVATMMDDGIDISKHTSNHLDEYIDVAFDYIITVCDHAKEQCPIFPVNAVQLHHNFEDPSKMSGSVVERKGNFSRVRDEIKAYSKTFVRRYL